MNSETEGEIVISADIDDGWHLYGLDVPDGAGPRPTSVDFSGSKGVEMVGGISPDREPVRRFDNMFEAELSWWDAPVRFTQQFKVDDVDGFEIVGRISYQGCDDSRCLPPSGKDFTLSGPGSAVSADMNQDDEVAGDAATFDPQSNPWWRPVGSDKESISGSPWWYIFLWGFIGGLIALLTPCVWPMIPLTVSFFLKKNSSKSKSVGDAMIYGGAIIVIYLLLGLAVTLIFDAGKLNELSTNAVFNLLFFGLLVVFAVSFLGAFDITLPSRWSNSVDSRAERTTGLISIFFMAFTLALVSFSCTGPIIGTLLVEAASLGDISGPAIGMGAFALALAIPFTLFAVFPSWLKELPRSGGWLNSVKVVLGFLELALSLKFLSVADLAYGWHILDREVFLALWIVIFALLGMYLLGKIRFSHDTPSDHVGVGRFFLSLASLGFAIYLVPGLWGAPLKAVSAFVPPLTTQDFNLYDSGKSVHAFDDFDEGMRYAAAEHKPVLVDFSGYGCVNCRKMEGAVFDTDRIGSLISDNYVMITLMVDDKRPLAIPFKVKENGKTLDINTIGD
ncbi:MAG: thioredoxin family protein [Muribaculaceae bacterium]|nr:thioredoxin family protein [Muribaculaceae bacterium]